MNEEGYKVIDPDGVPFGDDLFPELVVSQSLVSSYDLCAAAVGQKGQPGYDHAPNQQMSWGSMVHGGVEQDLLHMQEFGSLGQGPTVQGMRRVWADSLANERDGSWKLEELCPDEQRILEWCDEAVTAVKLWRRDVLPTLPELADHYHEVECKRIMQLGTLPNGRRVWFEGTGDLVFTTLGEVYDWKTSGTGWHPSKAQFSGQVPAYLSLYGARRFVFAVYNRRSRSWEMIETSRRPEEIDAYLRHAYQVAMAIDAGVYPVTNVQSNFGKYQRSWQCSPKWCGAWNICPYKYLRDDKWEQQIRDPREGWL